MDKWRQSIFGILVREHDPTGWKIKFETCWVTTAILVKATILTLGYLLIPANSSNPGTLKDNAPSVKEEFFHQAD